MAQTDPSTLLTLDEFYLLVQNHHPMAKQANLMTQKGALTVSQARGAFDPKLMSDFDKKTFDGKNYYDTWDTYVKIPTLLNVDFKVGYERNSGINLNPENSVPTDGLYYAGISVPVGQGLIYNQSNIQLKKSKFEQESIQNQARKVLNNLYLDANYAYWWWYENYQKREAVNANLQLIQVRFEGIRQGVYNGDKAAIDSTEMLIQVQQWHNNLNEAELNLQNSLLLLQNFVWSDSISLHALIPRHDTTTQNENLDSYLDWAIANHPDLKNLSIESNILELDRKMSASQVLPDFTVDYNVLLAGQETESPLFSNNYKMGFQFAFPLLTRKERSKLKIVKIKQQEYDWKIKQKNREIMNKIQQSYNKVYTLQDMIEQQLAMQINYESMLIAEQSKFDNGESSVFLLNSRENKKLQGEIKLIELQAKYNRAIAELKWATGKLNEEVQELIP
ncbi:hypothetical protein BFP72_18095 [Reichenbachiella sp. 5M10]|nr:hypothetical protein BFP72_18095 [Reichenbachiella sp. 5M10]